MVGRLIVGRGGEPNVAQAQAQSRRRGCSWASASWSRRPARRPADRQPRSDSGLHGRDGDEFPGGTALAAQRPQPRRPDQFTIDAGKSTIAAIEVIERAKWGSTGVPKAKPRSKWRKPRCASPPTSAAPSPTSRCSTTGPARSPSARRCRRRSGWSTASTRGVEKAGSDYRSAGLFLHGSTIAINTILERTGAKTALLITEGFRDVYEIGRINRPDAYNLFFQKHVPLVERALRFEVKERVLADGEVEKPLDEAEIAALGARARAARHRGAARSCSSTATPTPTHEARAKAILEKQPSRDVRLGLARAVARNTASSSAARPWSPTPISGRRCGAMSARSTSISAAKGFAARS